MVSLPVRCRACYRLRCRCRRGHIGSIPQGGNGGWVSSFEGERGNMLAAPVLARFTFSHPYALNR